MKRQVEVYTIGRQAAIIISKSCETIVFGISSRGIYLKSSTKWMLYLSNERFRGPLTINLNSSLANTLSNIQVGETAYLHSQRISFPETGCEISLKKSCIWQPDAVGERAALDETNCTVAKKLLQQCNLSNINEMTALQKSNLPNRKLQQMQQALAHQDTQRLETTLTSLLGYGIGLTPSGDDFVAGLLLRLNRISDGWMSTTERERINQSLVEAAYKRTNLLSANLIECAAMGLADERLIAALDWLARGEVEDLRAIEELLGWGHTSGAAALEGFLING